MGLGTMSDKRYNLNRPAHLIAAEVLRDIEAVANDGDESGFLVAFGEKSHAIVEQVIQQYQNLLSDEDQKYAKVALELEAAKAALQEINHRISQHSKPLADYMNANKGQPGYREAAEAYQWGVYSTAVHAQIAIFGIEMALRGKVADTPYVVNKGDYRRFYEDALRVILNTQELAGCDGLDMVIERAKAYSELCKVIHACVRLSALLLAGYSVDEGNALLAKCEKEAADGK
jgi:hypothetical protein